MTRFMMEISGQLGDYWKKHAEEELNGILQEIADGKITIDKKGVARNCIGRVLMDDMIEKVAFVDPFINVEATRKARAREEEAFLEEYRKNARPATPEELAEMRAAFGPGKVVVDVITGQEYVL